VKRAITGDRRGAVGEYRGALERGCGGGDVRGNFVIVKTGRKNSLHQKYDKIKGSESAVVQVAKPKQ
jgi:hypothetical protein